MIGATRSLAKEVAKRNVTVNAVAPGLIDTDMLKQIPVDDLTKLIPMRRLGLPAEVAKLVRFLASDDAAYITGQVITIDGGLARGSGRRASSSRASASTSPLGNDLPTAVAALREGRHGIVTMPEWAEIQGLSTRLAGVAKDVPFGDYPRKKTRSMGRVALLATYATERALADAGHRPGSRRRCPKSASPTGRRTARRRRRKSSAARCSRATACAASRRPATSSS